MKRRIAPLVMVLLLMLSISTSASAVEARFVAGKPTLSITGTTASCSARYTSGNQKDEIIITLTLKEEGSVLIAWSASGNGSVTISKTYTVLLGKNYELVLSASVNGKTQPDVSVTAKS